MIECNSVAANHVDGIVSALGFNFAHLCGGAAHPPHPAWVIGGGSHEPGETSMQISRLGIYMLDVLIDPHDPNLTRY